MQINRLFLSILSLLVNLLSPMFASSLTTDFNVQATLPEYQTCGGPKNATTRQKKHISEILSFQRGKRYKETFGEERFTNKLYPSHEPEGK